MSVTLWDSHVHSYNSFDGSHSIEQICSQAFKNGMSGITITDHCDVGIYLTDDWQQRLENSISETAFASANWAGKLDVSLGIELGQPIHDKQLSEKIIKSANFDLIIGAIHNLDGMEDFYFIKKDKCSDIKNLLEKYFEEQLEIVKNCDIDVLAHITYAYRYLGRSGSVPPVQAFEEQLRLIFSEIANREIAIELNTSGIYRGDGISLPDLWELKLFHDCGGEYVTLASDAHKAQDVGKGFDKGADLLLQAGFKYYSHFKQRKPVQIKL